MSESTSTPSIPLGPPAGANFKFRRRYDGRAAVKRRIGRLFAAGAAVAVVALVLLASHATNSERASIIEGSASFGLVIMAVGSLVTAMMFSLDAEVLANSYGVKYYLDSAAAELDLMPEQEVDYATERRIAFRDSAADLAYLQLVFDTATQTWRVFLWPSLAKSPILRGEPQPVKPA